MNGEAVCERVIHATLRPLHTLFSSLVSCTRPQDSTNMSNDDSQSPKPKESLYSRLKSRLSSPGRRGKHLIALFNLSRC